VNGSCTYRLLPIDTYRVFVISRQRTAASSLRNGIRPPPKRVAVFCLALSDTLSGFNDRTVHFSVSLALATIGPSVQKLLSACSFESMLRKIPIVQPQRCFREMVKKKGKAIPLQAWTDPESSRRLRLPDFKTIGT